MNSNKNINMKWHCDFPTLKRNAAFLLASPFFFNVKLENTFLTKIMRFLLIPVTIISEFDKVATRLMEIRSKCFINPLGDFWSNDDQSMM